MERLYDMKQKEVVNVIDGCRLGYLCDVEIDLYCGKIVSIIVPGQRKIFGIFGKDVEYEIPWECIKKIGEDIILVEVDLEVCCREVVL